MWVFVVLTVVVGFVCYYGFSEQGRRAGEKAATDRAAKKQDKLDRAALEAERQARRVRLSQLSKKPAGTVDAPISQVGRKGQGGIGLACPKCGGTQFKARRSGKSRAGIAGATILTGGIGGLAAAGSTKQKKVTCVTCGTVYNRG